MTVEIAAYVLLACLVVCIGFMIRQERKHRREIIGWEVQVQTLKDRVTSLTSLTEDIQASIRRHGGDPRAGLHPGNPDAEVRTEEAPRMRAYVAQRDFQVGSSNGPHIARGNIVQFDGRNMRFEGQTRVLPQLRGAIQEGWLRPVQGNAEAINQAFEQLRDSLRRTMPSVQQFNQQVTEVFREAGLSALPDDWQERLMSPEAVEGLEPRCYEVGPTEPVMVNNQVYEPGQLIPIEAVSHLSDDHMRMFLDEGLITPSQQDPRPTRYDRLTEDEDD